MTEIIVNILLAFCLILGVCNALGGQTPAKMKYGTIITIAALAAIVAFNLPIWR